MSVLLCWCGRPVTHRVDGVFKNGREATDWRCEEHAPDPKNLPSWSFYGDSARMFKAETSYKATPSRHTIFKRTGGS